MLVFEHPLGYFSVQVPEAWLEAELDPSQGEIFYALEPKSNSVVLIIEEDLQGELSLEEYADAVEASVLMPAGAENITRRTVRTSQGLLAIRLEASLLGDQVIRQIYLLDNNIAVSITYSFSADQSDTGTRLADYSLGSFYVN